MQRICGKCKEQIDADVRAVVCEGFCENINPFHLECVGLALEYADACLHQNIMWMCDSCRDMMESIKFRNTVNKLRCDAEPPKVLNSELKQLKHEIRTIHKSLMELSDIVKDGKNSSDLALPISTRDILSSTVIHDEYTKASTNDASNFELFLSNIAPDVTEEDVGELVRNTLNLSEPIYVKRLVPAWRNVTTLDYVSFKVKLKQKHRLNALDATIWPTGIRCREFKNYPTIAWKPTR